MIKPKAEPMTDNQLRTIVAQKVTGALGYQGSTLNQQRMLAEQYYKGEPYGNEQAGRSQVISRDVAESIDMMIPSLMRPFTSGDEAAAYVPRMPVREGMADEMTEYINWIIFCQNHGFHVFHNWIKDGLWKRLGLIKVWWDERPNSIKTEQYFGLTPFELDTLKHDEAIEIVEEIELKGRMQLKIKGNIHEQPFPGSTFNVLARVSGEYGCVKIANVPPEEFICDHRAVSLEEAGFTCHRRKTTVTELLEEGFDPEIVQNLGNDYLEDFNIEKIERFKDEDTYPYRSDNYTDASMREVTVSECYVKVDYDGDGYGELRQVILAGESNFTLLSNELTDDHPFCTWSPIVMPHKVYGESIADQTMDLQLIKSTLWRNIMDSLYLGVSPRWGVVENQVNLDDMLNARPGGLVRMKSADAVIPLPNVQVTQDAYSMMEYIDSVREARTGVKKMVSTIDSDELNPYAGTATGVRAGQDATKDRLDMIARTFGEIGVRRLYTRCLELVCKHKKEPAMLRMKGQYVQIDPREWTTEADVSISIGLGTNNRDAQLMHLTALGQVFQQVAEAQGGMTGPVLTWNGLHEYLKQFLKAGGFKNPEAFIKDPPSDEELAQQPHPTDPKMVEAQAKSAAVQQKTQGDLEVQQARMKSDLAINQQKLQGEMEMEQQRAQVDMEIERMKEQADAEREHQHGLLKIGSEHQIGMTQALRQPAQPAGAPGAGAPKPKPNGGGQA